MTSPIPTPNRWSFQIGYILILNSPFASAPPDTLAYVYNLSQDSIARLTYYGIFLENGTDLGLIESSLAERLFLPVASLERPIRFEESVDLLTAQSTDYFQHLFSQARQGMVRPF